MKSLLEWLVMPAFDGLCFFFIVMKENLAITIHSFKCINVQTKNYEIDNVVLLRTYLYSVVSCNVTARSVSCDPRSHCNKSCYM